MPLLLVQAFVNTWEAESRTDVLAEAVSAESWLRQAGLWDGAEAPTDAQLGILRNLREGIRSLLVAPEGTGLPDLAPLQDAAAGAEARIITSSEGQLDLAPVSADPLNRQRFRLMLIIRDAQRDGTWERLKACHNTECRWAFYDRSHTRRGKWCDMAVCGNRVKNRNLRARQR